MKYPDDYINKVICGDCIEVMKGIPNDSIDLVLTDPEWQTFDLWVLDELYRILKNGRHIFLVWHALSVFKIQPHFEKLFNLLNIIVLKRLNFCSGGSTKKYKLPFQWYPVLFGVKNEPLFDITKRKFDLKLATDVWEYIVPQKNYIKEPKLHPWQKDLKSVKNMIALCSNENDIVLDCFLGSGTTAVACKQLNRRYMGIEINPDYCRIARERLMGIPDSLFKEKK